MEYVIVTFSEEREVLIDGEVSGNTGQVLMVVKGTHRFTLSDPQDYTPSFRRSVVKDTTSVKPMEVTFEKAGEKAGSSVRPAEGDKPPGSSAPSSVPVGAAPDAKGPDDLTEILEGEFALLMKDIQFSVSLRGVFNALKDRLKPIWESGRVARLTPENVMLGLLEHGLKHKDDPAHSAGKLAALSRVSAADLNRLLAEGQWVQAVDWKAERPSVVDTKLPLILQKATKCANEISSDKIVAVRHLVAALLLPRSPGGEVGGWCNLPKEIFPAVEFTKALIEHVRTEGHLRKTDDLTKWEETLKELEAGLKPETSKDKKEEEKPPGASVGGGLNFSREASPEEVCLRADEFAAALKNFFVASQKHGELCFALFGHWGRGKSFLMGLTTKLMSGYEAIRFSAWKYPNVPEVWVNLYENFAQAAYPKNFFQSFPRIVRTGIAKHGGGKIITALAALAFALYPKDDLGTLPKDVLEKIGLVIGAGGVAWLLVLLSGVWKTTQRLNKDFLTATRHRDKLGLQATIGDDLQALLHGWIPRKQSKFGGGLFWALVFMICLVAGSAWWRIDEVAPSIPILAYVAVLVGGLVVLALMLFTSKGPERVLLIVDDLDRCKPDQLLTVVESIKVMLEEPEISSRVQVAMLVEEDVLEQAILEKYQRMGGPEKSPGGGTNTLGWSDQRIWRENSEKLFTAHLRLPPLVNEELEEIMLKVVTKERPPKDDKASEASQKKTPGTDQKGTWPPSEAQFPGSSRTTASVAPPAPQSPVKELVFTETDEKALLAALPALQKACEGFHLGPRSIRAFAFRYQLARLLLDQLKIEWVPAELAKALAESASYGKKTKTQNVLKPMLNRIIDQVA